MEFITDAKLKTSSLHEYINKRIAELNKAQKHFNHFYTVWACILFALNICTVILSIIGIAMISEQFKQHTNKMYVALTAMAAALVILLFMLQFTNVIYRSVMRFKYYKRAMHKVQTEFFQYSSKIMAYETITKQADRDALLMKQVNKYSDDALNYKSKKRAPTLVFRAMVGGEDA